MRNGSRQENGAGYRPGATEPLALMREFLYAPRQVASLLPSSKRLARQLIDSAQVPSAANIVELGTGTGAITRALLGAMSPAARLLSIEINPRLYELADAISDDRLELHRGDARELGRIVSQRGFARPDLVISGIPMSTMGRAAARELIETVAVTLAPRGRFVAYQASTRIESLCASHLESMPPEKTLVVSNFPPVWVTQWRKAATAEESPRIASVCSDAHDRSSDSGPTTDRAGAQCRTRSLDCAT